MFPTSVWFRSSHVKDTCPTIPSVWLMSLLDVLFPLIQPQLLGNFGGAIPYHSTKTNKDVLMAALNPGAQRDQEAVWCILSSKLTAKCRSRSPEWQPPSSLMSGRLVIHAVVFCEYVQMRPDRSWSIPFHVIGKFQGNPVFHPKPKNSQIHPPHHFGGKFGVLRGLHNINPTRFATCVMWGHFEPSQDSWACMYNPNCFSAVSLSVFCCWDSLRCSNPNLSGPFLQRNLGGPGVFVNNLLTVRHGGPPTTCSYDTPRCSKSPKVGPSSSIMDILAISNIQGDHFDISRPTRTPFLRCFTGIQVVPGVSTPWPSM